MFDHGLNSLLCPCLSCATQRANTAKVHDHAYAAGYQAAAYETYTSNIIAAETRALTDWHPEPARVETELDHALRLHDRWRDYPPGDDHLIRGDN